MQLSLNTSSSVLTDWCNQKLRNIYDLQGASAPRPVTVLLSSGSHRGWAGSWAITPGSRPTITLYTDCFRSLLDRPTLLHQAIEDTLLHELVHHIVFYLDGKDCLPHGREFRVHAAAINGIIGRDAVTIHHDIKFAPIDEELAAVKRRATSLLALASNTSNPHEAEVAAAKYQELMATYDFTLDAEQAAIAGTLPPMVNMNLFARKRAEAWFHYLLAGVCDTHACRWSYTHASAWNPAKYEVYGRSSKVEQVANLVDYLLVAIDREVIRLKKDARKNPNDYGKGRSFWTSVREGLASNLTRRLAADHKRRQQEGMSSANGVIHIPALVLTDHFKREAAAVEEFYFDQNPGFRKRRRYSGPSGAATTSGLAVGHKAGSRISINRQVSGAGSTKQLSPAR